jgi:Fe-S oxidoreductase
LRDVAEPFARAAAAALRQRSPSTPLTSPPLRYHDPCWLGRGLGEYQAPREILTRALGKAPLEFARAEHEARCVGGGAHLPIARKDTARDLALRRQQEHEQLGGGRIVSACANSVRSLRQTGADVVDLVTIVRQMIEK